MYSILRLMFSLGAEFGYVFSSVKILNPVDRFLLFIQPLFPLDFAIYIILVLFLSLAASSGYQWIGIGFPWIKVFYNIILDIVKLIHSYLRSYELCIIYISGL